MNTSEDRAKLTTHERRLKTLLRILAVIFGIAVIGYLIPALAGPNKAAFIQLPFVTNSAVKVGVLALMAFFAAADVRRYRVLTVLIIAGHIISELAVAATLICGNTDATLVFVNPFTSTSHAISVKTILWASMILDGIVIALLLWFYITAERARYRLSYLSPVEFRALKALSDVVVTGGREILTPEEVARNVDGYLAKFNAQSKWIMKLVLVGIEVYPLLSFKAPFSHLRAEERLDFIKRRFYQDVTGRLVPEFWRTIVQGMIRMGKQLSYLGYYNDKRTFASVGYVPFTERADTPEKLARSPIPDRQPLHVETPSDIGSEIVTTDVAIIGTGAAASIIAHGLARAGRKVLMLERGDYMAPETFTEDEAEMLTKLYSDGALQLSRDFRFQVLQGSCVGGTTVINNAVCFRMPEEVLARWNDKSLIDARLDEAGVWKSFDYVSNLIGVAPQNQNLNEGAEFFNRGVAKLFAGEPLNRSVVVDANIHECLGCGYCNIGCKYGKKLSMLETVLPCAQAEAGKEGLRILAGCEAEKFHARGKQVTSIKCRLKDGRRIEVRANTFVLSAGAVSSSIILLRSNIGIGRAGKRLSFNMGSPMTAVFNKEINAYRGLQISHYLKPRPGRGYVIETWFNPPVSQALTMPGWFEDHFNNMLRYHRMTCAGVLVGTEPNGEVRRAGLVGREIKYVPTAGDFQKLLEGLILSGEAFFADGAECVIPNTFEYREFKSAEELRRLPDYVRDSSDITIGTGHPQGGNILSANPKLGVVDPEFKAHGYDNLFVCDASVFPTSLGVNPQLTVMALANYAVPFVAACK
ncbi:MAG TPA: GMC family oxidoreductase [Blastocatellia bacterium]|jgi:choline dehydrogenase-like flavoprotein